jgi:transposase-like protein
MLLKKEGNRDINSYNLMNNEGTKKRLVFFASLINVKLAMPILAP